MQLYDLFVSLLGIVDTAIGQYIFALLLVMFAFMLFHRLGGR